MGIEELLLDQAKKEAVKKGELIKAKEVALAMKNDDMPIAQIVKFTGLSVDEIEKL